MLVLTGLAAGLTGGLLMTLLHWVERVTFGYGEGGFLEGVTAASGERRVLALVGAGVIAGVVGTVARRIKGKGDVTAALWQGSGEVGKLRTMTQAALSIVIVGMGATVGREGALKQAGAVGGNVFAGWMRLPDAERRLLVACGAGAGMAAAYNVPLGGAVFAMEVLLGSMCLRTAAPALAASFLATGVSWIFLPDQATYRVSASGASPSLMVWALLAGPLCGFAAVPFIKLLGWAKAHKPEGWRVAVYPVVALSLIGLTAMRYPSMLGNGKDVVQMTFTGRPAMSLLVVSLVLRPLATAICLRSGAPGGLFTPTMTFGGVAGLLLGYGWTRVWPGAEMGTYALIGSGAVLGAATQGPLSSLLFVLELTRTADATMVPLLAAVVLATLTTRVFEARSIYSIDLEVESGSKPSRGQVFLEVPAGSSEWRDGDASL